MSEIELFTRGAHRRESVEALVYPDGSPRVEDRHFSTSDTLVLRPRNMMDLMTGLFYADAREFRSNRLKKLVISFLPGARQDRLTNDVGDDFLFTLKSIAQEINHRHFDRVVLVDPHSDVAPALIDRSHVITQADIFNYLWPVGPEFADASVRAHIIREKLNIDGVIAPDVGASKKAAEVASALSVPLLQGFKHRDQATGKLSGFSLDGVKSGKHYLMVDDICDGGGTFLGLQEKVLGAGATSSLFITHGIFSKGTNALYGNGTVPTFKRVITTDTTTFDHGDATVLKIMNRILV